ncbi:hypothetical protein EDM68_05580 [Candidatus Uhrbacteria bacterium]|nr:MAG: hypothetical protein EDM68_05580 [Candidatus Uhrbacteria bacterium]
MNTFSKFVAIVSTLALLGQGCARPPAPTTDGARSARGGCENPYYPMRPDSSITYRMTGSGMTSQYTASFLPPSGGSNRVQYVFTVDGESLTLNQDFTCTNGTLSARGYADFSSLLGGQGFRYETESVEGFFLPADLDVGSEWETTYRMIVRTDHPQFKELMDGRRQTLRMKNKIVGRERVSVPAGTFEALKMQSEATVESDLGAGFTITFTNDNWLVRDVGLVKSSGGAEGYTSVTEAVEINR